MDSKSIVNQFFSYFSSTQNQFSFLALTTLAIPTILHPSTMPSKTVGSHWLGLASARPPPPCGEPGIPSLAVWMRGLHELTTIKLGHTLTAGGCGSLSWLWILSLLFPSEFSPHHFLSLSLSFLLLSFPIRLIHSFEDFSPLLIFFSLHPLFRVNIA